MYESQNTAVMPYCSFCFTCVCMDFLVRNGSAVKSVVICCSMLQRVDVPQLMYF